ncbi:hypothetical protein KIW84_011816 [Lathyrus oleraceus]|uniref:Integrase zinc-binding domain-containing protein n=1 Tax=Pisum sativum TaxID=3888 RepID=A0A9D5BG25_PEA|nr:hypothetical protein KIW84_011816 [Pisum sativum]
MKYYTKLGRVVTIHGDIEAARRCYDAAVKGQAVASTRKKGGNKSVIQEILPRPSIDKLPPPLEVNAIGDAHCWMTPIYNYLTRDELPADPKEATTVKRRACSYVLLEGKLYRRGFSIPLLKCVEEEKVPDILGEIHRGINAQHLGGRSLARKALRAGYYWPTMQNDSKEHVKRCRHPGPQKKPEKPERGQTGGQLGRPLPRPRQNEQRGLLPRNLQGEQLARPWNAEKLRQYYS